ncbi:hypothetical protein MtrunA17_Chr4g0044081 [Medicago truncatula]|uniref:Uncharacterized protein n=1 Tax=Medicago truncatula TaxID=3880 RepID=A0A396IBK4_MEDTR|nr:hypothetical protein MtrunA17_Chr4g0044081 [Medicago truncatula]
MFGVDKHRKYEPDPLKMTSIAELETGEKNVVETLARVMERKEQLLNNNLSSYDPSAIQVIKETIFKLISDNQFHPYIT